jgi:ABC-type glutathione transport system ATPase component
MILEHDNFQIQRHDQSSNQIQDEVDLLILDDVVAGYVNNVPDQRGVLHHLSLSVARGETLGLVGESGSGKSTLARVVTGLLNIQHGRIIYNGKEIQGLKWKERLARTERGIQMVFQDPFSSFNPKRTVGSQLEEALEIHGTKSARERRRLSHETLQNIGLSDSFADRYPHELSGGQLQRVALGCALITHPDLLIADEPVSALDVSVQAQILELIKRLQRKYGFTCLFISHDLNVIYYLCDRVAVLVDGQIVEIGDVEKVYHDPQHDYTKQLVKRVLSLNEMNS